VRRNSGWSGLIGESGLLEEVFDTIKQGRAHPGDSTASRGSAIVSKELAAQRCMRWWQAKGNFVAVPCAALTPELAGD